LLLLGLDRAPASTVALWLNLETVFTAAFARVFFGESLGPRGVAGILLLLGAATLLVAAGGLDQASLLAPGALFVAAACVCWGLDNNLVATVDGFTPAQSTAVKGLVAGSANLAIGLALEGPPSSVGDVVLSLVVGSLAYGASIVLYVAGSHHLGATRSQAIFSTAPVWGVALSYFLLAEPITITTFVAGAGMLLAIALVHADVHTHSHTHEPLVHTHWHRHDDDHHDHAHDEPVLAGTWHQHEHAHAAVTHDHAHRPDLHHRH
jgi:drug/metabolite transporter (DMT)-like permease